MIILLLLLLLSEPIEVRVTVYNAVPEQTNGCPLTTASGYKIDTTNIPNIIAISPDLHQRYGGPYNFKDSIFLIIPNEIDLSGWYVIEDLTHSRFKNTIDILQCIHTGEYGMWKGYIQDYEYKY
jgi:3D (Asp-Asp-Asp) domain-containing protein